MIPRGGRVYRYPPGRNMPDVPMPGVAGGMLSVPYDMGGLPLRDAGMSQPIPIGALASALANATPEQQRTVCFSCRFPCKICFRCGVFVSIGAWFRQTIFKLLLGSVWAVDMFMSHCNIFLCPYPCYNFLIQSLENCFNCKHCHWLHYMSPDFIIQMGNWILSGSKYAWNQLLFVWGFILGWVEWCVLFRGCVFLVDSHVRLELGYKRVESFT